MEIGLCSYINYALKVVVWAGQLFGQAQEIETGREEDVVEKSESKKLIALISATQCVV